ncbi:MAG: RNA polymerase factor sigma-54 [Chlamydiota bacterium]|nr:RNA polymerase factor sigma-54 [Chlamydiota bacterium]
MAAIRFEQIQRQTQRLIMSPQMQQAMHLLQMPTLELSALLRQEMDGNPVLEENTDQIKPEVEVSPEPTSTANEEVDFDNEFARLSQLDDEWREYYQQAGSYTRISDEKQRQRDYYQESIADPESLEDHLLKQLHLVIFSESDLKFAEMIVGNLDENGYLRGTLEDHANQHGTSPEEVLRVLKIVQTLHPVGVGARDLRECLLLQLERLGKSDGLEYLVVSQYLNELAKKNLNQIAKALNVSLDNVKKAVLLIATLEPKPGKIFNHELIHYVTPDVVVEKINDEYVVMLNDDRLPHIRINQLYKSLMKDKGTAQETKGYIREKIQSAKWLLKNIQQRQQTIYNVSKAIVDVQKDFLENGLMHLKPLTMQDIAKIVSIHESTVSRAIANKFMETPRGLFQIKFFFTSAVKTQSGQDVSSINVKEQISELIRNEDATHPLSDQDIVKLLEQKGIPVARRTITKYRKEQNLLSSHLRKTI